MPISAISTSYQAIGTSAAFDFEFWLILGLVILIRLSICLQILYRYSSFSDTNTFCCTIQICFFTIFIICTIIVQSKWLLEKTALEAAHIYICIESIIGCIRITKKKGLQSGSDHPSHNVTACARVKRPLDKTAEQQHMF